MGAYSELDIALRNKYQYGIDEDAIDPATAAVLLGGEIEGKWIRCPSPGCDADDRSMYVMFNEGEPYIYDCDCDYKKAYTFVRAKLGLSERPKRDTTDLAMRILYESTPCGRYAG